MDTKTLFITALCMSLATNLSMAIVFWTRRTYPGFGYWLAGHFCRTPSIPLFMLPREQFPPWLTIILVNGLLFAFVVLNNRGNRVFRGWRIHYGWEMAAGFSFCALFAYFTYLEPSLAARLTVIALYHGGFELGTIIVLLMRRPAYFGSSDLLQVVSLGGLAAFNGVRAGYLWVAGGALTDHIAAQPLIEELILFNTVTMLMLTLSQIMMSRRYQGAPDCAYLCIPLTAQSQTLGLLQLHAEGPLPPPAFQELKTLAMTVSESIKLALLNLRLREALQVAR